eukprot:Sdes_comp18018_c0_seq4m7310
MATRNRTNAYKQCREAILARRERVGWHRRKEMEPDDMEELLSRKRSDEHKVSLPPEWVDIVEEIQYNISRIRSRTKELSLLHENHITKPSFDDNMEDEQAIEILTHEITKLFQKCQKDIQSIGIFSNRYLNKQHSEQETKVTANVKSAMASALQNLSGEFRKDQSIYLKRLRGREQREKQYFKSGNLDFGNSEEPDFYDKGFTMEQLKVLEENTSSLVEREREIAKIAKSIVDLNTVFKEMSLLVIDQGTILDRIDYNIEQVNVTVEEGFLELKKVHLSSCLVFSLALEIINHRILLLFF